MQPGVEVVGPRPGPQRIYTLLQGGGHSNPNYRARWQCPACGFVVDEDEKMRDVVQVKADAHKCEYGWCAIAMTEERRMLAAISPFKLPDMTPTKEDRERWAKLRERNAERRRREQQLQAAADRTRDRVVSLR
jgi:hypothetical protein